MSQKITVDYLVIGAGAMGMAFVDTLFTDKPNATFAIVDRYNRPGGHWTKAYPFVRLHQPSNFYGVNSRDLGEDKIDMVGWNSGLAELATGDEILAYYTRVLTQQFLPSNRVTYYPLCEYTSDGEFYSTVTGKRYSVGNETRIVDSTFLRQKVPSMGPPSYIVADDVKLVTPNELVHVSRPFANYTIVGAGKTGIDACLWMLIPTSVNDLFQRQDASGALLRLSKNEWPTMFHCATITLPELEQIRKIEHIVRMGRVKHITADQVTLEGGKYTPVLDTLYIDCTVDGPMGTESVPVFNGKHITLQPLRACQQIFSAALIAHVEAEYDNDEKKNSLCTPVPHPNKPIDWLRIRLQDHENKVSWDADPKMVTWLSQCRLNLYRELQPSLPEDREGRRLALQAIEERRAAFINKLRKLYDDHETVNVKL
ncbi:hypothetical protein BELL_1230g00010 [Botrytis elliptica]|uniref:FAD/NAD(P)-binding domain-containing protein n=1 Tax=Botrytis elliptica TaxID=278938 RepID=A0A4Z1IEG2_9HELO|nr:hypothetical protein EAE99_008018 [Botrytis elliptica]TGO59735.1 hypothetical protein BELL_1230g00010 [Botrytis elliptica]